MSAVVAEEVRAVLTSLRGVFDDTEPVDELDHALQTAALALAAEADRDLVLAALLHDCGRAPAVASAHAGVPHEQSARAWIGERFGERAGWLAGAHVAAKQHLVATDPGYAGALSEASVASLAVQEDRSADLSGFVTHPWWDDALRLRRWDDAAKVPGATTPSVDDVLRATGVTGG
ncbi:MAG TPA: HD family phosphohydrolase [Mycobacteriales bacterium]|nr:HD family phosphohydrolase [Mycobacteriales bacterium]